MPSPTLTSRAADVLIVGGGPVGLLLANLLGMRGVKTVVLEQRTHTPRASMAIGVTPPSLEILKPLGLDEVFCREGVPVRNAEVHETGTCLGRLDFGGIASDYRFFLCIPQSRTIDILRQNLGRMESVTVCRGLRFLALEQQSDRVEVKLRLLKDRSEQVWRCRFLAGCDGAGSLVRQAAGLRVRSRRYPQRFIMGDFEDRSGLGSEAHLFFSPEGSVESFPLPGGLRRWIVLGDTGDVPLSLEYMTTRVRRLAGRDLAGQCPGFLRAFGVSRAEVESYHRGRVALAGDAAHVMSPIGGQGMNIGFADAEMLAEILSRALIDDSALGRSFSLYDRIRRRAYRVAATRAERGMWLGTARGRWASNVRRCVIRDILFGPYLERRLAPYFAMLTIPFRNLAQVPTELLPPGESLRPSSEGATLCHEH